MSRFWAMPAVPAFPGAANISSTLGLCLIFQTSVCSRAPFPMTITFMSIPPLSLMSRLFSTPPPPLPSICHCEPFSGPSMEKARQSASPCGLMPHPEIASSLRSSQCHQRNVSGSPPKPAFRLVWTPLSTSHRTIRRRGFQTRRLPCHSAEPVPARAGSGNPAHTSSCGSTLRF